MWARACWFEGKKAMEDVIPRVWVDTDENVVRWPTWDCKRSYMNKHPVPESDWRRFTLIKVKFEHGEWEYWLLPLTTYNITLRSVLHAVDGWYDLSDYQIWLFNDNLEGPSHVFMTSLGNFQCSCWFIILPHFMRTYKNRESLNMARPSTRVPM